MTAKNCKTLTVDLPETLISRMDKCVATDSLTLGIKLSRAKWVQKVLADKVIQYNL